jgi:hypothetical protein
MPSDRRKTPRQEMHWKALIVGVEGSIVAECMTLNVSANGARLLLPPSVEVPDSFDLILAKIGGVRRQCEVTWRSDEVTWRSDKGVGVRFVRPSPVEHEAPCLDDKLAQISAKD